MQEDSDRDYRDRQRQNPEGARPLGVTILGGINLYLFGLGSFVFSLLLLGGMFSGRGQTIVEELNAYFPQGKFDSFQLRIIMGLQMVIALIFSASGAGIMLKKEWARKLTLYFAFFVVAVSFVASMVDASLIRQAITQIIYPGVLIVYFTNKNVEKYFSAPKRKAARSFGGDRPGEER
jgi:hypothetical protein